MVTTKKLTKALFGGALLIGAMSAYADTATEQAVRDVETAVNNFKEKFQEYYGISANPMMPNAGTPKPSAFSMYDYADAKSNRSHLGSIFNGKTNQLISMGYTSAGKLYNTQYSNSPDGKDMVLANIARFVATPYQQQCNSCTLTVNKFTQDLVNEISFSSPYKDPLGAITGQAEKHIDNATVNAAINDSAANKDLSVDALLGPTKYSTTPTIGDSPTQFGQVAGQSALNFIQALISKKHFEIAAELPEMSEVDKKGIPARNKYLQDLYAFAAKLSIGLGNLQQMYAARVPVNGGDSKLGAETKMVMRHFSNEWQENVKTANALTLQRETAMLLAEINYQLFQNRMMMERLLATQSVMQIEYAQAPKAGGGSQFN